ncbi:MAG: multidrug effflux MFS transporter [bacterium]|nr:multidrug effflux MFS transporter [bacterium]
MGSRRPVIPLLVVILASSTIAATDLYLPSIPAMTDFFKTTEEAIQHTISYHLFGITLSCLFYGPLSDRFGRRPVMIWGMALFLFGSIACYFSDQVWVLTFWRFVQGVGAGVTGVVGAASVQDAYQGEEITRVKVMAWMGASIALTPAFAPVLGGHIDVWFGWSANFLAIAVFALIAFFAAVWWLFETHKPRKTLTVKRSMMGYRRIMTHGVYMGYSSLFSLLFGGLWAYITVSPIYFVDVLKVSPDVFGYFTAFVVMAYFFGAMLTKKLSQTFGVTRTLEIGIYVCVFSALAQLTASIALATPSAWLVSCIQSFYVGGMAMVFAPSTSRALSIFKGSGGSAAAVLSTIRNGASALGAFFGAWFSDQTLLYVALLMLGVSVVSMLVLHRLRRA